MQAITATIQQEQNQVVRHEDVPVLLVSGIAGSGKTSVLLQRIAYLFYQQPRQPRCERGLPHLAEPGVPALHRKRAAGPGRAQPGKPHLGRVRTRPAAARPGRRRGRRAACGPRTHRRGRGSASSSTAIDFRDIRVGDVRLISADSVRKLADKLRRIPAGPHRVTLMREELHTRLEARLAQMAGTDETLDELAALDLDEQLRIFHEADRAGRRAGGALLRAALRARPVRRGVRRRGERRLAAHRPHRHAPARHGRPRACSSGST